MSRAADFPTLSAVFNSEYLDSLGQEESIRLIELFFHKKREIEARADEMMLSPGDRSHFYFTNLLELLNMKEFLNIFNSTFKEKITQIIPVIESYREFLKNPAGALFDYGSFDSKLAELSGLISNAISLDEGSDEGSSEVSELGSVELD